MGDVYGFLPSRLTGLSIFGPPQARYTGLAPLTATNRLRELPDRPVNSQDWRCVRLFAALFDGLIHSEPPHASYTGLVAPTATKS